MSRLMRSTALALALLVLCSSAMYASPFFGRVPQEGSLAALWNRVISWLTPSAPASMQEKEGSQMDPNGLPAGTTCSGRFEIDVDDPVDLNGNR